MLLGEFPSNKNIRYPYILYPVTKKDVKYALKASNVNHLLSADTANTLMCDQNVFFTSSVAQGQKGEV